MCNVAQEVATVPDRQFAASLAWAKSAGEVDERAGQIVFSLLCGMRERIERMIERIGYEVPACGEASREFASDAVAQLSDLLCADNLCAFAKAKLKAELGDSDEAREFIGSAVDSWCKTIASANDWLGSSAG